MPAGVDVLAVKDMLPVPPRLEDEYKLLPNVDNCPNSGMAHDGGCYLKNVLGSPTKSNEEVHSPFMLFSLQVFSYFTGFVVSLILSQAILILSLYGART